MKILFTTLFDPDDLGSRYLAAYLKQFGHEVRVAALKTYSAPEYTFFPTPEDIEKCIYIFSTGVNKVGPFIRLSVMKLLILNIVYMQTS